MGLGWEGAVGMGIHEFEKVCLRVALAVAVADDIGLGDEWGRLVSGGLHLLFLSACFNNRHVGHWSWWFANSWVISIVNVKHSLRCYSPQRLPICHIEAILSLVWGHSTLLGR
ncbi:hypothetical protein QYF36_017194 [Acer negundo]|nr:hypothetical protein QYF36_017194 [Acer negundo]